MSRHSKRKRNPEPVNRERWLVSYADFITLLFAFFVVLFASSQADKKKVAAFAASMHSAFQYTGIFEGSGKNHQKMDAEKSNPKPVDDPVANAAGEEAAAAQMEQRIGEVIRNAVTLHHLAAGLVTTRMSEDGLVISMSDGAFFESGSATVNPATLDVLLAVISALPHQPMRIEGHTDDRPIHSTVFPTNWELSTARAAAITRLLIERRTVDPDQISAAGYAEFHPIATNATTTGRAQNRRVDIIILRPMRSESTPQSPAPSR